MIDGWVGIEFRGNKNRRKMPKKGGPKFVFWGRQVGAFSVFGRGYTGNPVQILPFLPFFSEIVQI